MLTGNPQQDLRLFLKKKKVSESLPVIVVGHNKLFPENFTGIVKFSSGHVGIFENGKRHHPTKPSYLEPASYYYREITWNMGGVPHCDYAPARMILQRGKEKRGKIWMLGGYKFASW